MSRRLAKILTVLTVVFVLIAIPALLFSREKISQLISKENGKLEVDFLDVGQGDAILIKTPDKRRVLIDGGSGNAVSKALSKELPFWSRRIDLVILTHPHDDHVGGLVEVMKRNDVKRAAYTGVVHSSPAYLEWLKIIRDRKTPLILIDHPQIIHLGDNCRLEIIYPFAGENYVGQEMDNINNSSIVARLVYGETVFLLAGDLEADKELELIESGASLKADVYKASHHGSDTSSDEKFLEAVGPDLAVISVGANNKFGHPSPRILNRLERQGAEILRTDKMGTIRLVSDGTEVANYK